MLLRRTLEETDRTAIVQFALRQKTRLGGAAGARQRADAADRCSGTTRCGRPTFPSLDETVRISAKELEMSAALVENFARDFTPEEFTDEYQEQLRTLIEAKLEQGEALDTAATFGEEEEEQTAAR